jgi:hypothetical protein
VARTRRSRRGDEQHLLHHVLLVEVAPQPLAEAHAHDAQEPRPVALEELVAGAALAALDQVHELERA